MTIHIQVLVLFFRSTTVVRDFSAICIPHHTPYIMHHTSYLIPHTSYHISHTSYLIPHTSYIIKVIYNTQVRDCSAWYKWAGGRREQLWYLEHYHHASHIVHHILYNHTSHIIHHTSHIIHHTRKSCEKQENHVRGIFSPSVRCCCIVYAHRRQFRLLQ